MSAAPVGPMRWAWEPERCVIAVKVDHRGWRVSRGAGASWGRAGGGVSDVVTGAMAEVVVEVAATADEVWGFIADPTRIGEWSPECRCAVWIDPVPEAGAPHKGDRFVARNRYPNGFEAEVECVVTEACRPHIFAWAVLDGARRLDEAGAWWRYELAAGARPGTTRIAHRFVHGIGMTGLRARVGREPDGGAEQVAARLAAVTRNMLITLEAMFAGMQPPRGVQLVLRSTAPGGDSFAQDRLDSVSAEALRAAV